MSWADSPLMLMFASECLCSSEDVPGEIEVCAADGLPVFVISQPFHHEFQNSITADRVLLSAASESKFEK